MYILVFITKITIVKQRQSLYAVTTVWNQMLVMRRNVIPSVANVANKTTEMVVLFCQKIKKGKKQGLEKDSLSKHDCLIS